MLNHIVKPIVIVHHIRDFNLLCWLYLMSQVTKQDLMYQSITCEELLNVGDGMAFAFKL